MPGNANGPATLARLSKMPAKQVRYVPDADVGTIRSISRGILFMMAFWSGSCQLAFVRVTELLARLAPDDLELVVVDVDGSPELYDIAEFKGKIHGYGESAWVHNGRVVATTAGLRPNHALACFEANTTALLALP